MRLNRERKKLALRRLYLTNFQHFEALMSNEKMREHFLAYQKAKQAYEKELMEVAIKNIAKAENLSVSERSWNNSINIDFNLPRNLVKLKQPEQPQQTYWEHNVDRSLVVAKVSAMPTDDIHLFSLVMVDLYGSDDTLESGSAEITQMICQGTFQITTKDISYSGTVGWMIIEQG